MGRLVLSQNERLLLHLSEQDRFRDDADVPMAASQEGIAQKLQVQIHNASRALASLQAEGLVFDRLAHVRGAPKRRRAYFLTEKGRQAAQSIKSGLSKQAILLELEGKVQELPLEEAVRKIALATGASPSFSEVVDAARTADAVRASDFARPAQPERPKEYVERAHGRPKVEAFFGREDERKSLSEALSGQGYQVALVWGMPGIGKSTLASKMFDELSGKRSMFWYSFREWDTEASFLAALTGFLKASGRTATAAASERGDSIAELYVPLTIDLGGSDFIFFFDDIQKAGVQPSTLLAIVLEAVRATRGAKAVLLSRAMPQFYSKTAPGNLSIELIGLDRDSAWRMAQSLSAKDAVRVVDESHGHPLLLMLMSRGGAGEAHGDVIAFIEREVYSSLPEQDRNLLELLSVFRHPIPVDAVQDIDYQTVVKLRERALIVEQQTGIWTHDLLREFFSTHVSQARKLSLHRLAAAYCETHTGVEWKLETLFHLVEANDWGSARRISLAHAPELAKEFPEETLGLISRIPRGNSTASEHAELVFLKGQLSESLGRLEMALSDYEESLSLLGGDLNTGKRALVLESVAKLQSQVERWSESLSAHERALQLYEKEQDRDGQTREWLNIGGVFRKKGSFAEARDAYNKALSLAAMTEDRSAQAACLNNIALLDWDEGRLRDSEMRLKESIRLAHAVRDHAGEARGLQNLADLFSAQMRGEETCNLLLESSEAFRRAGEIVEFKRLQASCAEALGSQGRYVHGIELCEKALARPELRRRKGLFQKAPGYDAGDMALASTLVDLLRQSGDLKRAQKELARVTSIAQAMDDPSLKARGQLLQAIIREDSGDLEAAKQSLEEARTLLVGAGNSEGLIAVHMRLGIVEEKLGDYEAAAKDYSEASRHAELTGNRQAHAIALENLSSVRGAV